MELSTTNTTQPCRQQLSTDWSAQSSQTTLMAKSETRHLAMNLVTAEGDKVTLSIDSQSQSLMAGYSESGASGSGQYSRQGMLKADSYERSMELTVEGDLNRQEKKDLRKVIKTIKRMMHKFVNDKLRPMMSNAKKLGELDTVAGLEVQMSYSRQTLKAEQKQISTTYNQQGQVQTPPVKAPVEVPTVEASPVEVMPAIESNPTMDAVESEAKTLTDAMAREMSKVNAFIDRLQGAIQKMFDDVRDQMAAFNPEDSTAPALMDQMQENLLAKVLEQKTVAEEK